MKKQLLNRWIYSFSIQLLIMHIKKNQILVLYWVFLFGFVTQSVANKFGIPYLFLDPEYMGHVGGRAFLIMGLATGAFIMAFNISSYILNSFRFPFLACLSKTFQKYTINNFIIPASFLVVYVVAVFRFQHISQLKPVGEILQNIGLFLVGVAAIVYSTWKYFLITNKDIYKLFGVEDAESENFEKLRATRKRPAGKKRYDSRHWRVETYLTLPLKTALVRDTSHYEPHMLQSVFKQNHINAAVVEIIVFGTFIVLGLFRDFTLFKIPAGASILLLFTMIIMLSGVFRFWLRAWANTAIVAVFLLLNFLSQFEAINPANKAYGLDYEGERPAYTLDRIESFHNDTVIGRDKALAERSLVNWKENLADEGIAKPRMVLLSVSGGGLRSTLFTFRAMQALDSVLGGRLMQYTKFISGSSGGLIGAAYYRELYLKERDSLLASAGDPRNSYLRNISKDLLNAVAFSFTVSDLFLNMQTFRDGEYRYVKDRAYAFEKQLNDNTHNVLDRRMRDYIGPELLAHVPMMAITPTILNDGRAVIISSLPASYLLQDYSSHDNRFELAPDGIELNHFFDNQDASNLKLTSALRLNATFPYIMPAASLPSDPPIEVMDAGIRDNYGIIYALRFLHAFRDWINENTSGVVILQVRDNYKLARVERIKDNTIMQRVLSPLRNVTGNFILMQDYNNDQSLAAARSWFDGPMDFVQIEMPEMENKISLSWHLTEREKNFIVASVTNAANRESLKRLARLLAEREVPVALNKP